MMFQISRCLLQLCNYTGLICGDLYRSSEMTSGRSVGVTEVGPCVGQCLKAPLQALGPQEENFPWSICCFVTNSQMQLSSEQCTFTFYTAASNIYKHVPPQSAIRYALSKTCRRNNFTHAHRQVASNFCQPNDLRCDTSSARTQISSIGNPVLLKMHHKHRPLLV